MSTPTPLPSENAGVAGTSANRFESHNFEAHCYNTTGCSVFYFRKYQLQDDADALSPPPSGPDYRKRWGGAVEAGIENFPEPALVKWKSRDGTPHEARVDIGQIFADQRILHRVPQGDIPANAVITDPTVLLEVNDRTVNVYMKAHVPTRQPQLPDNRYSDFRDDVILAWSHTY